MNFNDLNEIEGLQFIPVNEFKQPMVKEWQTKVAKYDLNIGHGVGLVCGSPSGNVEVIDIDLKYDITGKLYNQYKRLIHDTDETLLAKLVVQKTKNGGYHFIYRCDKIEGNLKLANRPTTIDEKNETYKKTYDAEILKSKSDEEAKKIAKKAQNNDNVRVLLESRGLGGQIVCFPTKGYEFVHGDLYSITQITPEQRDILHGIARQFNQVLKEVEVPKASLPKISGLSPFEDYNNRGDVVKLLENHGWKTVKQKGSKTIMLRSGQTTSQSSGNYDHEKKWFSVFTTSTEFEPEKAYLPYAVFAKLECNDDFSLASKRLLEMGYGEAKEEKKKAETPSTRVIKSRVVVDDDDFSFLAKPSDYEEYLQQVMNGTLPMGLTTGSNALDEHFLFKRGDLVITLGHDNVGKTVWIWWLFMLAAMYHGWKGIIFSSENTLGNFMRKMIQFYWGKPLVDGKYAKKMTESEYKIAKDFVEKHFILIKAQEELYNYKDILNMVKKAKIKHNDLNYCLIDPYNSLKTDLSGFSKLSTHDYHYEALSEIKAYGQQNNLGFFINNHAVTESLRKLDKDGYPLPPNKADVEGGGKFANKCDSFLTIHRKVQHPTEWMITEVHVRKVKDTETGGRPTDINLPVKFKIYNDGTAFMEYLELGGTPVDPIAKWHLKNQLVQKEMPMSTLDEMLLNNENPF